MTEIKIEKKKPVWPWILLGLGLIAVLIYFVAFYDNDEKSNKVPTTSEQIGDRETEHTGNKVADLIGVKENNSTVADYVNFVETHKNKMGLDHEYTNEALLKLIKATNAIAREVEFAVEGDLDKVKEHANNITLEPFETTHANSIRKASDILTNILQNIQNAKYPGLNNEITELRNASEAINPDVLTLDQRNEVKAFFSKAADLLHKMN